MTKKKDNFTGDLLSTGMSNIVGVGMMDATSSMVNSLSAGTAKTLAGTAVGLQGVALLGNNLKLAKKSLKSMW